MAAAAETAVPTNRTTSFVRVVDFSPETLRAPFALRCAAFSIDYMLLILLPIAWLFLSRMLGDGGTPTIGSTPWIIGAVIFLINFIFLPLIRGKTVGKMLLGLTIINADGTDVSVVRLLLRNTIGYLAVVLTLGFGFFVSALNATGRSLADFIGGTIVIRGKKV